MPNPCKDQCKQQVQASLAQAQQQMVQAISQCKDPACKKSARATYANARNQARQAATQCQAKCGVQAVQEKMQKAVSKEP